MLKKNIKISKLSEKRLKQYKRRLNWCDTTQDVNQPTLQQFLDGGSVGFDRKSFQNDNILFFFGSPTDL